jgi:hypothetical protein
MILMKEFAGALGYVVRRDRRGKPLDTASFPRALSAYFFVPALIIKKGKMGCFFETVLFFPQRQDG